MKKIGFLIRVSTVARGALVAGVLMSAGAVSAEDAAKKPASAATDGPTAQQLTQPTNTVEAGAGYVTDKSAKFGEYNGLFDKGIYGVLGFDLRGGGLFDSEDATRWRVLGTNLGLDLRRVTAEYGQQGRYRVSVGFDELQSKKNEGYQTPYRGARSGLLTLPSNWLKAIVPQVSGSSGNFRGLSTGTGLAPALINGVPTPPSAAQQAAVNTIIAADVPAFHSVDIGTKRTSYSVGFNYALDRQWDLKLSASKEDKKGTKAMSTVTSQSGEYAAVLPDPIDQSTEQYNASVNFNGEHAFYQAAYYGSVFKNSIQSVTWQDANDLSKSATMSSAPDNEFHQLGMTGGYRFSSTTKLVVFGSYARNTQDQALIASAQNNQLPLGLPVSSLKGLVVTKALSAKLTAKPVTGLNLGASYKFDDRHNSTPVHTYYFQDANEARASGASPFNAALGLAPNTLGSNINIYANRPYSKKLNQANLDADYAIARGQALKAGYEYQQIERQCDGSWIDCADAPKTKENTVRLEWRASFAEAFSARVGYARSQRKVDYDENAFLALVPMANVVPTGASLSVYQYLLQHGLTGFGPVAGFPATPNTGDAGVFSPNNNIVPQSLYGSRNNINELVGMRRFNMADRDRDKIRGLLNWDASEKLSVQAGVDYDKDQYSNSVYGLKSARDWAANLDGTYSVSDNFSANAFFSHENRRNRSAGISYGSNSSTAFVGQAGNTLVSGGCFSTVADKNKNAKIDPCLKWSTDMLDVVDTVGAGFDYKHLLAGKLDLAGSLVYSDARSDNGMTGGTYANNPLALAAPAPALAAGVPAVFYIPAADLPTVTTKTVEVRLNAQYELGESSAVRAFYWFQRLRANDYAYEGMQFGSIGAVMPTNEKVPDYSVHVLGLTYVYRWQ